MIVPLILYFIFTYCTRLNQAQVSDVIGCGGFIKSETDINYKVVRVSFHHFKHGQTNRIQIYVCFCFPIQVQLITKDGIPIYTTEAAPING